MSTVLHIAAHEHGIVRVFAVDLPQAEAAALAAPPADREDPLKRALGAQPLDRAHLELVRLDDLDGLGLSGYLAEGYGIPEQELEPFRQRLEQLSGQVLIVTSRAFGGEAQTLRPSAPLRLIASFREAGADTARAPLHAQAAQGDLAGGPAAPVPTDRNAGRRTLIVVLVVLALGALFLLMAFGGRL